MLKKIQLPPDSTFRVTFKRRLTDDSWGPALIVNTIKNANPPAKPSKPVVSPYLGQINVLWNGLPAGTGNEFLPDFNYCEVHVSEVSNFAPSSSTRRDQFSVSGEQQQTTISDLEYGVKYYVRLVAYNTSGIASEPSDQAEATPRRVTGIDVLDGSINLDKVNFDKRVPGQQLVYYNADPPSSTTHPSNPPQNDDLWMDTNDQYKSYRRVNGQWVEVPIGASAAKPGSRVWYQAENPLGNVSPPVAENDMWYRVNGEANITGYVFKSGGWVMLKYDGTDNLAPGTVAASRLVANSITANQIAAGAITASEIATGAITAGKIFAGAVTADKMAANSITAANGAIANLAVDDANIANVNVGKLTAGTITANILLAGLIRTADTGRRVEISAAGIRLYNSSNTVTTNMSTATGYTRIVGDIVARTFRSQGYDTGGTGYIEIGDTGATDPTDEIRMFYQGSVSSIRNPSDRSGSIRMSLTSPSIGVIDWTSNIAYLPSNYRLASRTNSSTYVGINGDQVTFGSSGTGNGAFMYGTGGSANNWMFRNNSNVGGAIKLSGNLTQVQIRNAQDTAYGDLEAQNIRPRGVVDASGRVTGRPLTSYGTVDVYDGEMYVANNITSRNGGMWARYFNNNSDPDMKMNITELNIDALSLLGHQKIYAFNWKNEDGTPGEPDIGMLTSELPYEMTHPAGEGPGESYRIPTFNAIVVQAIQQLNAKIERVINGSN